MAQYTSTAQVVLTVNGKQAQRMLTQLEKDAKRLETQIAKAAAAGDKASTTKLQRELNQTKKAIDQIKGAAASTDQVLRRLDKSTPKELNRALKQLQSQLNGIQRGTAAWDAQVAKIRMVKAELQKVNATLQVQRSLWSRLNTALNNAQTAIMAVAAALTGLIMAGRKAVQAYADMEESMANTMKYTRMTAAEVEELNEIFKGMDTRLAREQLNLLAQEGGRLGYNTVQSVREYVEAASIINVALVDLGEGATQTIAKLSNIFGMEQMYGVRDSMLKIGSTVNHLSQNCTAAKPFIVEFAQRMAGIGATAKMTIPEIMAFAATLDANGQKVEMSATALQRTIMALYKKPAEMAKKVGLDANEFIVTLNRSTTDGVMVFLEALNKLGESNALAVLSPLFQDLGLDGARVSSVLTNLSSHLEFLKWQMGEASEAFREGTSASNEYAIFNNTVQASIDKARKRVSELAIELGEKLYPLMKHIYTSSSVFLRVLSKLVDFFIENRRAILLITSSLIGYYTAVGVAKVAQLAWHGVLAGGKVIMTAYNYILGLSKVTMIAFTQGLGKANTAFKALNATMKMNPFGAIIGLVTTLVVAISNLSNSMKTASDRMTDMRRKAGQVSEELVKEQQELNILFARLRAATEGTEEYKKAKDAILNKYGKYLKGLVDEKGKILNLEAAYNRLTIAVERSARVRGIQNAKQSILDEFSKDVAEKLTALENAITFWTGNAEKAAEVRTKVAEAVGAGKPVPQDIIDYINSIHPRTGANQSAWGAFNTYLNTSWFGDNVTGTVGDLFGADWRAHWPAEYMQSIYNDMGTMKTEMKNLDAMLEGADPLRNADETQLNWAIETLTNVIESNQAGPALIFDHNAQNQPVWNMSDSVSVADATRLREEYLTELAIRGSEEATELVAGNPDFNLDDYNPYETDRERRAREAEERRAEIKARKEFKDSLNDKKGEWEARDAQNISDYSAGLKSWQQFLLDKYNSEIKYYDDRLEIFRQNNLEEDEDYQELLKKKEELQAEWLKRNAAMEVAEAKRQQQAEETQAQMDYYTPGNAIYQNQEALNVKLHDIRIKYLRKMQAAYNNTTEEYHNYAIQLEQEEAKERLRIQQNLATKVAEWKKKYEYRTASERYNLEMDLLHEAYMKDLITYQEYLEAQRDMKKKYADQYMPDSAKPSANSTDQQAIAMKRDMDVIKSLYDQGILDKHQYEEAKARIERSYRKKSLDGIRQFGSKETNQLLDIYEAWQNFFNATEEDGGNWATRLSALASSVFSVMTAGMQQASEFMQACTDIEVAKAEKKYDREIELAEGNSFKVKKAEQKKEKEIAKIKNDAAKKQFAIQVIQAVAQTATNALNAYGSAAAVPVIGYILAPIAAAMAVAAGAMQIATIKKQQQAQEAQGYSEGGFTPSGRKDEAVGVVHAGEWVASQKLVNNPRTRPLLEALDYAQRTNTIGSLTANDVSRSITAPMMIAAQAPQSTPAPAVINNYYSEGERSTDYVDTMRRLADRLDEPFVTVNTVTGDHGIQRAQDEYDRLIRNKSPKSKK